MLHLRLGSQEWLKCQLRSHSAGITEARLESGLLWGAQTKYCLSTNLLLLLGDVDAAESALLLAHNALECPLTATCH
jgi:hypothetical protein